MEIEQWLLALGVSWEQIVGFAVLAVILVIGWTAARVVLRLTAALFRAGCAVIFLFLIGGFILSWLLF
jgi:hypothetical protein